MKRWVTKAVTAAAISFLLLQAGPAAVMAAGDSGQVVKKTTYEKEIPNTLDADIMERKLYESAGLFENEITEGGKKYTLENVFYTVDDIEETWKGEDKTITLTDIREDELPGVGYEITENGVTYIVKDVHVTARAPKPATEEITEDVRYAAGESVPAEITVTREGEDGSFEARLTLTGTEASGEAPETREIPVIYHNYDVDTYIFGGTQVPRNDERPALEGLEGQILASAALDPADWTITDYRWSGAPYESGGELLRNAAATATRRSTAVTAHYRGTHTVEQPDVVTAEIECETVVSDESKLVGMGRIATVHVTAEGMYSPVKSIVPKALLAGAGIVAIAAAVSLILFAAGKKDKKDGKEA